MTDAELDIFMAETVMGWHVGRHLGVGGYWLDVADHQMPWTFNEWHPSTNIEQAFQVLGQFAPELYIVRLLRNGNAWHCQLEYKAPSKGSRYDGESDIPCRAICLAAYNASNL